MMSLNSGYLKQLLVKIFRPVFQFYTALRFQKIFGFPVFSGGTEMEDWPETG